MAVVLANLGLVLLFPPYDYISLHRGNVPTFSGFQWYFSAHPNHAINRPFLQLECFVILLNAAIAWFLMRDRPDRAARPATRYQRGVLWFVGMNLVVMLLFPPFQNYTAVTNAALPSFEGFYFVFGDNSQRQLVTTILYILITLVLINGALLWLMFRDRTPRKLTPEQIRALAQNVRAAQK